MSNVRNNIFRLETPDIEIAPAIRKGYETLINGTGAGAEMRGWMNWPAQYLKSEEYARLKETAKKIIEEFKHTIVIGIGGSYLGAKAIIDAALGTNSNELDVPWGTKIHFVASLSAKEWLNIQHIIGKDTFCIIYISKSGTTLEPGSALRYFYEVHKEVHGTEATVFAITDKERGTGRKLADKYGWESFVIPDNIGGRYSVFTPVGLLPIAAAGIDTDILLKAAAEASELCLSTIDNPAVQYANWRYNLYEEEGLLVEFMAVNNPELRSFAEWWKQLFGESDGKDEKGLFPTSGVFSMDLHSLGQYLQDGTKGLIGETFFTWDDEFKIVFPESSLEDGLDYLVGRELAEVNHAAMEGSFTAHSSIGDWPNPCCKIFCSYGIASIAYAMYIFKFACPIGGYAIGVNPFDQPGVESYKIEVKQILSKNSANNS